jgi:hypothetical protein
VIYHNPYPYPNASPPIRGLKPHGCIYFVKTLMNGAVGSKRFLNIFAATDGFHLVAGSFTTRFQERRLAHSGS